jgi:D-alanyl-D-alanine carboxypeptidase
MRMTACCAAALLAVCGTAKGDRVDDYIRHEMSKRHIPGVQLAVLRDGKPLKMAYYGLANIEHNIRVRRDTLFQIQSMTKSFVGTAILMLVEEGKADLDGKLSLYLEGTPKTWGDITLRHLLDHTSGIKDFINEPTASLRIDVTEEEVFKATAARPLNFPTGEKWLYSNTNYLLLGMVISKLTGKSWSEFVEERIFRPLRMKNTRLYSHADVWPNRASGYIWGARGYQNGEFIAPSILSYAGGGLASNIEDLAKWDAALYGEKLLKQETFQKAWTKATVKSGRSVAYGLGWQVSENNGRRVVGHGGSHRTGFTSHMARYLDDRLTVIVLTNLRGGNPATMAAGVAHLIEPHILAASGMEPKSDPDPQRTERLKTFLYDVAKGVKESALVVPGLSANLDEDDQKQIATVIAGIRSFEFLEERDIRGNEEDLNGVRLVTVCAYRLTTSDGPWFFRFWLAQDGRVATFSDRE